jgi:uncharacterized protein YbjT (DUF2867 family)
MNAGHEVVSLARSEASARKLTSVGAKAYVGLAEDLESLREGARGANVNRPGFAGGSN